MGFDNLISTVLDKFLSVRRVPHTWYLISDSDLASNCALISPDFRKRKSEWVMGWGEKEGINLGRLKHVWTVWIADRSCHVIPARHAKTSHKTFGIGGYIWTCVICSFVTCNSCIRMRQRAVFPRSTRLRVTVAKVLIGYRWLQSYANYSNRSIICKAGLKERWEKYAGSKKI